MAFLLIIILPYQPEEEHGEDFQVQKKILGKIDVSASDKNTNNAANIYDKSTEEDANHSDKKKSNDTQQSSEIDTAGSPKDYPNIAIETDSNSIIIDDNDKAEKTITSHSKEVSDRTDANNVEEKIADATKVEIEDMPSQMKNDKVEDILTPLDSQPPIHVRVEHVLEALNIFNVHIEIMADGKLCQYSFVQEGSQRCENILRKLKSVGVGNTPSSSVSVFQSSYCESFQEVSYNRNACKSIDFNTKSSDDIKKKEILKEESRFKKSIKSRLVVAQVVASVKSNALFTFDYLLLIILASIIACLGLVENSSVALVASMLISPLMGPILAATFGQVVRMQELRNLGIKSELVGLSLCLAIGFAFGLITGVVGLHGAIWGSTDAWPTAEMKSRGLLRSLWVGVLIALPSGAGVAISILGDNAGSLVGVAISASLLPPACNAGMLWAYALLAAIIPPKYIPVSSTMDTIANTSYTIISSMVTTPAKATSMTCSQLLNNNYVPVYSCNLSHDAALLGLVSLMLTVLNIVCILVMGVGVLKIKEVAPHTAGNEKFWHEDVNVARSYYITAKGKMSKNLGQQFLKEWKEIRHKKLPDSDETTISCSSSLDEPGQTIDVVNYIKDVEESPETKAIIDHLKSNGPIKHPTCNCSHPVCNRPFPDSTPITADLNTEYNEALMKYDNQHASSSILNAINANHSRVYKTFHTISEGDEHPRLQEVRKRFSLKRPNTYIESDNKDSVLPEHTPSKIPLRIHNFFNKKKSPSKFQVVKVDEEEALV